MMTAKCNVVGALVFSAFLSVCMDSLTDIFVTARLSREIVTQFNYWKK